MSPGNPLELYINQNYAVECKTAEEVDKISAARVNAGGKDTHTAIVKNHLSNGDQVFLGLQQDGTWDWCNPNIHSTYYSRNNFTILQAADLLGLKPVTEIYYEIF